MSTADIVFALSLISNDLRAEIHEEFRLDYRAYAEKCLERVQQDYVEAYEVATAWKGKRVSAWSAEYNQRKSDDARLASLNAQFRFLNTPEGVQRVDAVQNGQVTVNYEKAEEDGRRAADDTINFYNARVAGRIEDVIGGLIADAQITNQHQRLSRNNGNVAVTGSVKVVVEDYEFVLNTTLKTNYRYGENSANGVITVYQQVPTTIDMIKGERPARTPTVAELLRQKSNDRKAELNAQIRACEKLVEQTRNAHEAWGTAWHMLGTIELHEKTQRDNARGKYDGHFVGLAVSAAGKNWNDLTEQERKDIYHARVAVLLEESVAKFNEAHGDKWELTKEGRKAIKAAKKDSYAVLKQHREHLKTLKAEKRSL